MSGGSEVALPKPAPNRHTPAINRGTLAAGSEDEDDGSGELGGVADAGDEPPVGAGGHQQTQQGPGGDRETVIKPIASPACCAPRAGTSREKRCAIMPICAKSPSAMAARASGSGDRATAACRAAAAPAERRPDSGAPARRRRAEAEVAGVARTPDRRAPTAMTVMTKPIAAAATGNPSAPMAATHNGEKTMPPTLRAVVGHPERRRARRTNQGATIALTRGGADRSPARAAQCAATKSCHGASSRCDHPARPAARTAPRPW